MPVERSSGIAGSPLASATLSNTSAPAFAALVQLSACWGGEVRLKEVATTACAATVSSTLLMNSCAAGPPAAKPDKWAATSAIVSR